MMGQVPLYPPNVKGWPGGRMWINTSTIFVRYNAAVQLAQQSQPTLHNAGKLSAEQVVDEWVMRLIGRPVSEDKRRVLVDALGGAPARTDAMRSLVQLIVSMPEYQLC